MKYTEAILTHLSKSGMSTQDAARLAGISRATFFRIVSGEGNPRIKSVCALLRVAGYKLEVVPDTPSTPTGRGETDG